MAFPAASLMPVVSVAVYVAPGARDAGAKVAVEPEDVTAPDTVAFAASVTMKVAVVRVEASRFSPKGAVIADVAGTPMAPSEGEVPVTAGGAMSAADPVVKDQDREDAKAFPAGSFMPVVSVAV
jgi:hypothetical protein